MTAMTTAPDVDQLVEAAVAAAPVMARATR